MSGDSMNPSSFGSNAGAPGSPAAVSVGTRPRWVLPVLLGLAAVFVGLAISGIPLLPLPTRSGNSHVFTDFGTGIGEWQRHSGYRFTSDSWIYWAGAVGLAAGGLLPYRRVRGFTGRYLIVAGSMLVVLALGPLVQRAVGLPLSNYDSVPTFGAQTAFTLAALGGVFVVIYFGHRLREILGRRR